MHARPRSTFGLDASGVVKGRRGMPLSTEVMNTAKFPRCDIVVIRSILCWCFNADLTLMIS